eukprot:GEMP01026538.1.p1 GENE.GEMP01026538.1~~GEMP01026538.1.p1  ORF type:complete len:239 (+),score=19.36 GEMP01026538.1:25-717(+)
MYFWAVWGLAIKEIIDMSESSNEPPIPSSLWTCSDGADAMCPTVDRDWCEEFSINRGCQVTPKFAKLCCKKTCNRCNSARLTRSRRREGARPTRKTRREQGARPTRKTRREQGARPTRNTRREQVVYAGWCRTADQTFREKELPREQKTGLLKLDCESLCHGYPDCVAFSYVPERFWCSMYIGGPYVSAVYSERFPGTICTVMDLSRRLDLSQNTIRATNMTSPAPYFVV